MKQEYQGIKQTKKKRKQEYQGIANELFPQNERNDKYQAIENVIIFDLRNQWCQWRIK